MAACLTKDRGYSHCFNCTPVFSINKGILDKENKDLMF